MASMVGLKRTAATTIALAALAVTTACTGGSSGDSTASAADFSEKGPITLATGKDLSGYVAKQVAAWNVGHPDQKVTLRELAEDADLERQQMIQNAQNKSDDFTIVALDVVLTAEFAAKQYIDPLPEDKFDLKPMLPSTVDSATYFNKLYGVPWRTDAGLLYYRDDLLKAAGINEVPTTWDEMKSDCDKIKKAAQNQKLICYGGQFNKYEGLTVNFAEAVASNGGTILSPDGKTVTVDSPEAQAGLQQMVDGFKNGYIDKGELTWTEEEGRNAFQQGKVIFQRNWPYMYTLANKKDGSSKVAGKFKVAPLPGATEPGASSLGGYNLAVSKYAKNKGTAIEFIKFLASEDQQRKNLMDASRAPALASLYDDPKLLAQFPYLAALKASLKTAQPRPKAVQYGDVTKAIQDAVYAALQGQSAPADAVKGLGETLKPLIK